MGMLSMWEIMRCTNVMKDIIYKVQQLDIVLGLHNGREHIQVVNV